MSQSSSSGRGLFSGNLGYVLAVAGSAVGLGNIWRFPYLAAKYGGGIFLLVYFLLLFTFGYALIMAETSLGRNTRLSPVGAYRSFADKQHPFLKIGGWLNAIVPMIILPYYCLIGGWIVKYMFEYVTGGSTAAATDGFFVGFITSNFTPVFWHLIFLGCTALIILKGVEKGVERASVVMMPILLILAFVVAVYSMTRPGAGAGIAYYLIPDFSKFSIMTVVAACGQLFFSLSVGMGILITYGSYMKKDVDLEQSVHHIEIFDTGIAFMAGLMVIPSVFAFSGGDEAALGKGPGLMFITLPKVFDSMKGGSIIGALFFLLVLFAALTSSVSVMEAVVSSVMDKFRWNREKATVLVALVTAIVGIVVCLGYNLLYFELRLPNDSVGQILDVMDYISNYVLMPVVALASCVMVGWVLGPKSIIDEVTRNGERFGREKLYVAMIKIVAPVLLLFLLLQSLGVVKL